MKRRTLNLTSGTIAVASLSLGIGVANAHLTSEEQRAMDTCIQQFLGNTLADYPGKVTVRKEEADSQSIFLGTRSYQVEVSAKDRSSGKHLGNIVCTVNEDGTVKATAVDPITRDKVAQVTVSPVIVSTDAR